MVYQGLEDVLIDWLNLKKYIIFNKKKIIYNYWKMNTEVFVGLSYLIGMQDNPGSGSER